MGKVFVVNMLGGGEGSVLVARRDFFIIRLRRYRKMGERESRNIFLWG